MIEFSNSGVWEAGEVSDCMISRGYLPYKVSPLSAQGANASAVEYPSMVPDAATAISDKFLMTFFILKASDVSIYAEET